MNQVVRRADGTNVLSVDLPEEVFSYAENLLAEIKLEDHLPADVLGSLRICLKQIVASTYGIGFNDGMTFDG